MKAPLFQILLPQIAALILAVPGRAHVPEGNACPGGNGWAHSEVMLKMHEYHDAVLGHFDANQDGKLDGAEVTAFQAAVESGSFPAPRSFEGPIPEFFKRYGVNTDGKLSDPERLAIAVDAFSGKLQGSLKGNFAAGRHHHHQLPAEILKRCDKDGDGKLNAEEWAALRADIQSGKAPLGRHWPHGDTSALAAPASPPSP